MFKPRRRSLAVSNTAAQRSTPTIASSSPSTGRYQLGRRHSGNMMVFSVACTLGILGLIAFFGLGYMRLMGSNNEQRTAIESAAMAAAMDLSRIVIKTDEFGYVGLSDAAPNGSYTNQNGGDGYSMSVHGYNTLLGTARLDLMIASIIPNKQGNNSSTPEPVLTALAKEDIKKINSVQTQLQNALNDAILPNPKGIYYDTQGKQVNVYQDALTAYQKNKTRMTGDGQLAANSLKLQLGYLLNGMTTNTNIPLGITGGLQPPAANQMGNNCYKAYVDVPFGGQDFYFAAIGDTVRLVDKKDFSTVLPNLPNTLAQAPLASVVRAEADQNYAAGSNSMNATTVHAAACAVPANVFDPKPYPGLLTLSFPDGQVFDFVSLTDVWNDPQLNNNPGNTTAYTSANGDYPVDPNTSLSPAPGLWPISSPSSPSNLQGGPCPADYMKLAFYDWLRRAGTKANIAAVIKVINQQFNAPGPDMAWNVPFVGGGPPQYVCQIARGIVHTYQFNLDGSCTYSSAYQLPMPYHVVSQNQLYVEAIKGAGGLYKSSKPANFQGATPTASFNTVTYNNISIPDPDQPTTKANRDKKQKYATGSLTFTNTYDMFVIDECRIPSPGATLGGIHGGEPCDISYVVAGNSVNNSNNSNNNNNNNNNNWNNWWNWNNNWNNDNNDFQGFMQDTNAIVMGPPDQNNHGGGPNGGIGDAPLLAVVSDFAEGYSDTTTYNDYSAGGGGAALRPTYKSNGLVADIRFRRDIQVSGSLASTLGFKTGYLAEEDPPY